MISKYEFWKTTGGSIISHSSVCSGHTSTSDRTFQSRLGVQAASLNFYCGSKVATPGPGTYSIPGSFDDSKGTTFCGSQRLMSATNKLFSTHRDPHVETHSIDAEDRKKLAEAVLGSKMYRYNSLKYKKIESGQISKAERDEMVLLKGHILQLKEALENFNIALSHAVKTPVPKKKPFATSSPKPHEKPVKYSDTPHFYRSEADWDFGHETRGSTINMAAFNYPILLQQDMDDELSTNSSVMTGVVKPKSRCRKTDFFGWNAGENSITPNAFAYSPEAIPIGVLKHHNSDISSAASGSGASSCWKSSRLTFERSRSSFPKVVSTKPKSMSSKSAYYSDEEDTVISGLTACTKGTTISGRSLSRRVNTMYLSKTQFPNGLQKKMSSTGNIFLPDIVHGTPKKFTMSTDDNFASKYKKHSSKSINSAKLRPTPVVTANNELSTSSMMDEISLSPINKHSTK